MTRASDAEREAVVAHLRDAAGEGRLTVEELAERIDYAMRNTRVLTRRTLTALEDGEPVPDELPDAIAGLATAVGALTRELGVDGDRERARRPILDVVHRAPVLAEDPDRPRTATSAVLVAQVRSIAVDLLQATGLDREDAQRGLRDQL